jgi:hypothetical protein
MARNYTRNTRGKLTNNNNKQLNWNGIWSKNVASLGKLTNPKKLEENKKLLNVQSMLSGNKLLQHPVKEISLNSIEWNPSYNRGLSKSHLYQIMSNFDLRALGQIFVCDVSKEHGGKKVYEIIDGNHRMNACKTLFGLNTRVKVMVLPYMPIEERALVYEMYNDQRKAVTQAELFKAREIQKDEDTLNIRNICTSIGVNIAGVTESSAYPVIKAFNEMYKAYNYGVLAVVLRVIRDAYAEASTVNREVAFGRAMIRSMTNLINIYWDELDFDRLASKVGELSSREWINRVNAVKQSDVNSIMPFVEHYNKNLRSGKLDLAKQYIPIKKFNTVSRVQKLPEK